MSDPVLSIDDHLLHLRQAQSRPDYRRRILEGVVGVAGVSTLRVLRAIERAESRDRSPSIRDIALDLGIEQSTASRAVHDTTQRGLTIRRTCDDDQRRVLLALTPLGHEAADRATYNRRRIMAAALSNLSADDVRQIDHLLGSLVKGLLIVESDLVAGDVDG